MKHSKVIILATFALSVLIGMSNITRVESALQQSFIVLVKLSPAPDDPNEWVIVVPSPPTTNLQALSATGWHSAGGGTFIGFADAAAYADKFVTTRFPSECRKAWNILRNLQTNETLVLENFSNPPPGFTVQQTALCKMEALARAGKEKDLSYRLRAAPGYSISWGKEGWGSASEMRPSAISSANPNFSELHYGEDMYDAGDYRSFSITEPRVELCLDECARDSRCKSVTYTKPGTYGNPQAACWLKERPGRYGTHANAISAIKTQGNTSATVAWAGAGRWSGSWTNSRGESGQSTINIRDDGGIIKGDEDGWAIEDGRRVGNVLTWQYRNQNNGCRNYSVRWEISVDGRTANGTYTVTDRCTGQTYTGNYLNYHR